MMIKIKKYWVVIKEICRDGHEQEEEEI